MIKLILSDMDGTLLDENGQLPQEFAVIALEHHVHELPDLGNPTDDAACI